MSGKRRYGGAPTGPDKEADEAFDSPAAMADAIDALVRYLTSRYARKGSKPSGSALGFVIEQLRVEFSPHITDIEVITNFGDSAATIVVPSARFPKEAAQDQRRIELLRYFFPAMKEAQLRATLQLYRTLRPKARQTLLKDHGPAVDAATKTATEAKTPL